MDFDNYKPAEPSAPASIPTAIPLQSPPTPPPRKKGLGWKIFWGVVLVLSILTNLLLLLALGGMAALVSSTAFSGLEQPFEESVLIDGPRHQTLAVINLKDIIDETASELVRKQLEQAANDPSIRGVIVRIVSPGGYVSSSDQIYNEIKRFREQTGKPAVAFMQSVAASGGYYSAVACDKIVAEPTVITGSIGVILSHLVIQDLLEQKLGINPVVVKSGEKKDWPSLFHRTTEEQTAYLKEKLIQPAFERFLEVVCEGRRDVLTPEEVRRLADGSIYPAPEALQKRLIDQIGYLQDAVAVTEQLAAIQGSRVIEYKERFAFWDLLAAQEKTSFKFDTKTLHQWTTPQLMYLWDGRQ
ncbi:MAG TPA: signal peptide peptidase SppA [Anaerohalosphaeraceae bacterium]|nr:signal peptide peptidase SppA [Anaerohalosphaeraceae bacterium]HOL89003.1 signal peptide peptidase SppA [Anaerohalosphaeraceae bacterium]HPP56454.1 signal peptide peptidase SppA [Anaerohalosphaeraceae bacterium]